MQVETAKEFEIAGNAARSSFSITGLYNSPYPEHCVLITRCDPSGKVSSGSKLMRLTGAFPLA